MGNPMVALVHDIVLAASKSNPLNKLTLVFYSYEKS